MIKRLFPITLLVLILLACLLATGCVSSNKAILNYADNFVNTLDLHGAAWDNFNSTVSGANFDTPTGISTFQTTLPTFMGTFGGYLNVFQGPYPNEAPQDLKDAVRLARDGTTKIITGLAAMDNGLTSVSPDQVDSAYAELNDGNALVNQAVDKYNSFVDNYNTQASSRGPNIIVGIIIGTGLLWLLMFLVVKPLTKMLTKRRLALQPADVYLTQDANEVTQTENSIYNKTYIMVDVV